ncbi:DUF805 domain-containing protein [Sphingomonas oligophenolica]|uniref:DUF805 domain-containing protein n=1 Tax=Sphingomonas oligophenolica TaxID=301154 RepID=A0ABU9XZR2_9SPHN
MNLITRPWRHYADFKGRSRRLEYLLFWLTFYGALFVLTLVGDLLVAIIGPASRGGGGGPGTLSFMPLGIFALAAIVPALALSVRRLHDLGISGWWMFIWLVPIIGPLLGWVLSLIIIFIPGPRGENQYGPDPHDPEEEGPDLEQVFS